MPRARAALLSTQDADGTPRRPCLSAPPRGHKTCSRQRPAALPSQKHAAAVVLPCVCRSRALCTALQRRIRRSERPSGPLTASCIVIAPASASAARAMRAAHRGGEARLGVRTAPTSAAPVTVPARPDPLTLFDLRCYFQFSAHWEPIPVAGCSRQAARPRLHSAKGHLQGARRIMQLAGSEMLPDAVLPPALRASASAAIPCLHERAELGIRAPTQEPLCSESSFLCCVLLRVGWHGVHLHANLDTASLRGCVMLHRPQPHPLRTRSLR